VALVCDATFLGYDPCKSGQSAPLQNVYCLRPVICDDGAITNVVPKMRIAYFIVLALCLGSPVAAEGLGGRLLTIKESRTLKIAHRADSRPFAYLDDDRRLTGYT
jgi:hypothetical protein